jgi:hypothetical protein
MLERSLACAEGVRRKAQEFQRKAVAPLKIGLAPSISVSLDRRSREIACTLQGPWPLERFLSPLVGGLGNVIGEGCGVAGFCEDGYSRHPDDCM